MNIIKRENKKTTSDYKCFVRTFFSLFLKSILIELFTFFITLTHKNVTDDFS